MNIKSLFVVAALLLSVDGFAKSYRQQLEDRIAKDLTSTEKSAIQGDPKAQRHLGLIYLGGYGVKRDYQKAEYWLEKAVKQGEPKATELLISLYEETGKNPQKMVYWLEKINNPWAYGKLGKFYATGEKGVKQDYQKAEYWLEKAAKQGNQSAIENLASLYEETGKNPQKMVYWLEKINKPFAYRELGNLYANGEKGVKQDYQKAIYWHEKNSKKNYKDKLILGRLYEGGKGAKPDYQKAKYWYEQAIAEDPQSRREYDIANAKYALGRFYEEGKGVKQDYQKAIALYKEACRFNKECAIKLGRFYEEGKWVKQDYKKAIYWYEKSANSDDLDTLYHIGMLYYEGKSGKENQYQRAQFWWKEAARQGHKKAKEKLKELEKKGY